MIDSVIHKHLDKMDAIEKSMQDDIDKIVAGIDIDLILADPEAEMLSVVAMIKERLMSEHIPNALQEGVDFSLAVKKDGEIIVPKTKDPKLNEGVLIGDDKRRD